MLSFPGVKVISAFVAQKASRTLIKNDGEKIICKITDKGAFNIEEYWTHTKLDDMLHMDGNLAYVNFEDHQYSFEKCYEVCELNHSCRGFSIMHKDNGCTLSMTKELDYDKYGSDTFSYYAMDDCEKEVCDFQTNKVIVGSLYFWGDSDTKEKCALDVKNTKPEEYYEQRGINRNPTAIVWFDNKKCFYAHDSSSMVSYKKNYGTRHRDRPFWFADPFLDIHDFEPKFLTANVKKTWACCLTKRCYLTKDGEFTLLNSEV